MRLDSGYTYMNITLHHVEMADCILSESWFFLRGLEKSTPVSHYNDTLVAVWSKIISGHLSVT
jgi:hypothetical protein